MNKERKQIEELERKIIRIQQSTRATWTSFIPLHDFFRMRFPWYYRWHVFSYASVIHIIVLFLFILSLGIWVYLSHTSEARAATIVWDGGGDDISCGGSSGDGNKWSCALNWSDDTLPIPSDAVVFNGTSIKNAVVDDTFNGKISTLSINSGYTGTISLARSLQTIGAFTLSDGIFSANNQTLDINGTLTLSAGSFTASSGTMSIAGGYIRTPSSTFSHNNGTIIIDGNTTLIDPAMTEVFHNLTFAPIVGTNIEITGSDSITVLGTLTLSEGNINQTVIPSSGTLTAQGDIVQESTFDGGSGKIIVNGTGSQTFTGNATLTNGDINDITFNKSSGTLVLAGTIRTTRPWTYSAGTIDPTTNNSTIVLSGEQTIGGNYTLDNVIIADGTHLKTLVGNLDVDGNLTILDGNLDVSPNNYNVTIAGNWENNGIFIHRLGTVTLDGIDQTISGSTSFYNLSKRVSTASTLTFEAKTTQIVVNSLTLTGTNGQSLFLRSSTTNNQWIIDPQAIRTVAFLDVKDSKNSNTKVIDSTNKSNVDSGNNNGWVFDINATPPAIIPTTTPSPNPITTPIPTSGSLDSEVIEQYETVIENPSDEQLAKKYVNVIKVVDKNLNPIAGATVTLYSEPRTMTTAKEGIVQYEGVEPGRHRVVINYGGQVSEDIIHLKPSSTKETASEFNHTIQLKTINPVIKLINLAIAIGVGILIILYLFWLLYTRKKRHKNRESGSGKDSDHEYLSGSRQQVHGN